MDLSRERPTIAVLLMGFLTALASWALDLLPDGIPAEVTATGYVLILTVVAVGIGKAAQGQLFAGWLGESAPWANDTHTAAVAAALFHDPDDADLELLLARAGVGSLDEARILVGLDPKDDR